MQKGGKIKTRISGNQKKQNYWNSNRRQSYFLFLRKFKRSKLGRTSIPSPFQLFSPLFLSQNYRKFTTRPRRKCTAFYLAAAYEKLQWILRENAPAAIYKQVRRLYSSQTEWKWWNRWWERGREPHGAQCVCAVPRNLFSLEYDPLIDYRYCFDFWRRFRGKSMKMLWQWGHPSWRLTSFENKLDGWPMRHLLVCIHCQEYRKFGA